ncbi:MAG: FadR family transcriptional regulator [Anaerolineae bacterium]|nr:MAG: FadR family transcriptional regulator [Anaerolineae bacterium]
MPRRGPQFELLDYLAHKTRGEAVANGNGDHPIVTNGDDPDRIPSLTELSAAYDISIATLREQLGVARALGLVEVRPKTGIRRLPYSFTPAVQESLTYAIACDRKYFDHFSALRKHLEADFWYEAVSKLTAEDIQSLKQLLAGAEEKLHAEPIRRPHAEHRQLHLTIFRHIDNPFVIGLLEAYWDAYEVVGLDRHEGITYLEEVWDYHRKIVDAIAAGKFEKGHAILIEHMDLIYRRPVS